MSEINRKCKECGTWVEDTHSGVPFVDGTAMCMDCFREDYKHIGGKVMDAMKRGGVFDEEVELSDDAWFDDPEWIEMNRGEPFDAAWDSISKAPIYTVGSDTTGIKGYGWSPDWKKESGHEITEPLYSGGHRGDEMRYATEDLDEALAYALFGSATGDVPSVVDYGNEMIPYRPDEDGFIPHDGFYRRLPMRTTIPTIYVTDPSTDYADVSFDPQSAGYMFEYGFRPKKRLDDAEVRQLIEAKIAEMTDPSEGFSMDEPRDYGVNSPSTTADLYKPDEQLAHMQGALERLAGTYEGPMWMQNLDDRRNWAIRPFLNYSTSDRLKRIMEHPDFDLATFDPNYEMDDSDRNFILSYQDMKQRGYL